MDATALQHELIELRKLPRAVLSQLSTKLTIAATMLAGKDPQESACVLHAARVLHVIAHERLADPVEPFPRAVSAPHAAPCRQCLRPHDRCEFCGEPVGPRASVDGPRWTCDACGRELARRS